MLGLEYDGEGELKDRFGVVVLLLDGLEKERGVVDLGTPLGFGEEKERPPEL